METAAAFRDLVELIGRVDQRFAHLDDEQTVIEGYRWILSILQVGAEVWLYGDPQRPRFVDIVGPTKKWGGDNTDAAYQYAPVDPRRTYRVTGRRGDAVYLSLTVYGGPDDGRYSTRIVGSARPEGDEFTLVLGPGPDADIVLEPDAVAAITRDYRVDPNGDRPATWRIECLDGEGDGVLTDADMARRLRAVATWVEEQAALVPVAPPVVNDVAEPYPVPTETFGWAAGDAAYAFGAFDLADDEALVVRGRSPDSAVWNQCLWTPYLHTYDAAYDRVTINGGQIAYEPDGSWEVVIAARDPGHPNWLATQGHRTGLLWFRWFLPAETPARPFSGRLRLPERPDPPREPRTGGG
jgi:hypothetical protein